VVDCNIHDNTALKSALQGADAVINLVGILFSNANMSFKRVHADLPLRVATICQQLGIKRLLHMSALKASADAPSEYLRSKAAGEVAVKSIADLHVTIFRPSIIFGAGDGFFNLFAGLAKIMPVILLAMPSARFQPIFVDDVARAFVTSLENIDTYGQSYDLGGPKVYSLRDLVAYTVKTIGLKRTIVGLSDRLSYLQAYMMEFSPIKLMTRDNYYSMQVDSVTNASFPAVFNFSPKALEAVVPEYLAQDAPRQTYMRFRGQAGR
jgi:NADH dehydrogenase